MRLLIYAMESSGASLFCYFVGQRADSVAIVDLWSGGCAPALDTAADVDVVLKATVTAVHPLDAHIASFRPDKTVLLVRDPLVNYPGLAKYFYANQYGTLDEKFQIFEGVVASGTYDVIRYEDFIERDPKVLERLTALGWPVEPGFFELPRSVEAIMRRNFYASDWAADQFDKLWGFGNIRGNEIVKTFNQPSEDPALIAHLGQLCPFMMGMYGRG